MTLTTAILLNGVLGGSIVLLLAAAVRFAHRFAGARRTETLHPSQPLDLSLLRRQETERGSGRAAA